MDVSVLIWLLILAVAGLAAAVFVSLRGLHAKVEAGVAQAAAAQQAATLTAVNDASDRLRTSVQTLQIEQERNLAANREEMIRQLAALNLEITQRQEALKAAMTGATLEKLSEQALNQQQAIEATLRLVTGQITATIEGLTKSTDSRLAEIGGKVNERLEEGFKKTNDTFVSVMQRLATIDEAQKKIDGLTTNVVSLQQLLGDKRSRGALGERQLEDIIKNALPESVYEFQYTLSTKVRPDCVLKLPEPTGMIAIDAKFPLEAYEGMYAEGTDRVSPAVFKTSVRKHIDDIAGKYILPGETSDGAMMFVPAESVFAEIHGNHRDLVDYAAARRVWLVSPTTLMAVLNTARVVLKDVETRRQVHVIQDALGKLGVEFSRFDERMRKLGDHIRQAHQDVDEVAITSKKISDKFASIHKVELEDGPKALPDESKPQLTIVKPDS